MTAYERRNYGPERVADAIVKAIVKNRAVAPVSPEAWGMYLLKRLVPALTARANRAAWARFARSIPAAPPSAG